MLVLVNDSPYFDIVIRSIHEALDEIPVPHRIVSWIDPNDTESLFLLCTTHENKPLPKRYISYNMEQLTTERHWSDTFFQRLRGAEQVWDYSRDNIEILAQHGIQARFVPFGYARCLETSLENRDRRYDFIFTGCGSPERDAQLASLTGLYPPGSERYKITNGCWGEALNALYREAKIGLNIHYYRRHPILEVHRIVPLIANRVWVISEPSSDTWYSDRYTPCVDFYEPGDLKQCVQSVLALPSERFEAELERRYRYLTTHCRFSDAIATIPTVLLR